MGWVARLRKRIAIRGYVRRLGPLLRQRYGPHDSYSPGRISTTVTKHRLSAHHVEYACAMYASRRRFVEWMKDRARRAVLSRPAPSVEQAASPYRTRLDIPPEDARSDRYYVELFSALRSEVAAEHNGGNHRFLPPEEQSFEQYSNGDNPSAAARWGLG